MQVLMDVRELRYIRVRWFKIGGFFTLMLGLAIVLILASVTRGTNVDNKIAVTNDFQTVKPEIYSYPTPAVIVREPATPAQTNPSLNDWGVVWLVAFFTLFVVSMVAVIVVYLRSKARWREIKSKPKGFWDWNEGE